MVDNGANLETAVIAAVGSPGATTASAAASEGSTVVAVASGFGFNEGQAITIDSGANAETATVASVTRFPAARLTITSPLAHAHAAGAQVAGTGITLTSPLARAHAAGTQLTDNVPTPGAPNKYSTKPN
jgi:hypothetical protein